jgi:hypothetical protein
MRERASQEGHLAQTGHGHVADKIALAGEVTRVFLARHPRADALGLHQAGGPVAMIH